MEPQVAQWTLQFLQRCNLQPAEIEAFQRVVADLSAIANPPPRPHLQEVKP